METDFRAIDRVNIRKVTGCDEWRACRVGDREERACYEGSLEDAIGTASHEWPHLPIYYRGACVFHPLPQAYDVVARDASGDCTYTAFVSAKDAADLASALNSRVAADNVLVENGTFDERQTVTVYACVRGSRVGVAFVARPEPIPGRALYLVSADHVCPEWRLERAVIEVRESAQGAGRAPLYYATHRGFGCGKDAASPHSAIYALLLDSGCSNIRIERAS